MRTIVKWLRGVGAFCLLLIIMLGTITARAQQPDEPSGQSFSPYTLILTQRDNGGFFSVPVNGLIWIRIPRSPNTTLSYNTSILRPADIIPMPMPMPLPRPLPGVPENPSTEDSATVLPSGWRLVAVQPGVTAVTLVSLPCKAPPCPLSPIYAFQVTIRVTGRPNPTPIPPFPTRPARTPIPPRGMADVYISTAYLEQTVSVRPGQTVAVELPFLSPQDSVSLSYDSSILRPLSGQTLTVYQSGGWQFTAVQAGSTAFEVLVRRCPSGELCPPMTVFRVTIRVGQ